MSEPKIQKLSNTEYVYHYRQFFEPDALKVSIHIKAEDGNWYRPVLVEEADRYATEDYPHSYYVKLDLAKGALPSVGTSGHPFYGFSFDLKDKGSQIQHNIFRYTSRFYHQGKLFEVVDWLEDKIVDDRYQYYQVKAQEVSG